MICGISERKTNIWKTFPDRHFHFSAVLCTKADLHNYRIGQNLPGLLLLTPCRTGDVRVATHRADILAIPRVLRKAGRRPMTVVVYGSKSPPNMDKLSRVHMQLRIIGFMIAAAGLALGQNHWIGTWGASPSPQARTLAEMSKSKLLFSNQTIREIVHLSAGGSKLRVRLSNAYGKEAVTIGAAHVALHASDSAIGPGSDHVLMFSGRPTVTIPPDAVVISDAVQLDVPSNADLTISLYVPGTVLGAGIHYSAQQTNYIGAGDLTGAAEIPNAKTFESWVFLTGVDTAAPANASTLVAFGDSITDGAASTNNANHRWPNLLADRLAQRNGAAPIGVLDEGIGGNRILHDPNEAVQFGESGLARYGRDVLAQPGVKYEIVLEGINDLGHAGPHHFPDEQVSAEDIIAGLEQLVERAHEHGIKIFGGTLTPFAVTPIPAYYSPAKDAERKKVNEWIRTSHAFDGVVDFEKALEDPANPGHMQAQYDSGDHLHPNDAGYKAMADAVDLSLFQSE